MPFHGPELIIILAIALLIFGPKKLPEMGSAIGKSIKEFKKGMSELTAPKEDKDIRASATTNLEAIEREIAARKAAAAEASPATATKVVDADEPEVQARKEDKTEIREQ
jgi:sec-independent protein translocase protein TatA